MGMPKGARVNAVSLRNRRLKARSLLDAGLPQAEVARWLGVSRQSVSRWARLPRSCLGEVRASGRKPRLGQSARARFAAALSAGPRAAGFSTERWSATEAQQLLARRFGLDYSLVHTWRLLRRLGFGSSA